MFIVLDFAVGRDDGNGQGRVGIGIGVSIWVNGGVRVAAELATQGVGVADEGDTQVGVGVQGGQGAGYRFRGPWSPPMASRATRTGAVSGVSVIGLLPLVRCPFVR